MNDKIMIIDHSAVCHAVKFSLGKYKLTHDEKPTFVIYGYLNALKSLFQTIRPDRVVIACDSNKSKRKKIYPSYKSNRLEKSEEEQALDLIAYPQFNTLKESVLPEIGFSNIFEEKGLEGDDIIASVCKTYTRQEIVIVANDKDLYQLLTLSICMWNPRTRAYFTDKDFMAKYNISPEWWGKVKQIAGCTTDDVGGIDMAGETTAIKFIKGDLPKINKSGTPNKAYQSIKKGKKIIKRNKKLVVLPFKNTPEYKVTPDHLSIKGFKKVCKAYGFKSLKKDLESWTKTLRLK